MLDEKFLISIGCIYQIISFISFKEPLPYTRHSPIFSSKSLTLPCTFRPLINLELTFVCDVRQGPTSNSFFPHGYPIVLAHFLKLSHCSIRLPLSFIKVHVKHGSVSVLVLWSWYYLDGEVIPEYLDSSCHKGPT